MISMPTESKSELFDGVDLPKVVRGSGVRLKVPAMVEKMSGSKLASSGA